MATNILDSRLTKFTNAVVVIVLVLVPLHSFLTVWASSAVGHYTLLRLWKEVLLVPGGLAALWLLARQPKLQATLAKSWLARIGLLYILINLVWGAVAYAHGQVSQTALLYGELVNLRLLAILLIAWIAASSSDWLINNWRRLVVWPAVVVVAIGLLQWLVLPYDYMKHFGYGPKTIGPYETIDHDINYIRIRSTLRGANLLGGYLIIVLSFLGTLWSRSARKWWLIVASLASLGVLYASGSRGAWLGVVVAAVVLVFLQVRSRRSRQILVLGGVAILLIGTAGIVALRNNDFVQNTVFHTDEHSTSSVSSNQAHLDASSHAAKQVATEPLGRGPGTAGPASQYNYGHNERIAENYFLQIGQETGWLGLASFLGIYVLLAMALWRRRRLLLARVLLASLAGLTVMGLLMHIWTDDTIAYLWWGLAGVALTQPRSYRITQVVEIIKKQTRKRPVLVAIDGFGGSGKSTLAEELRSHLGDCAVIAIDDFIDKKKIFDESSDWSGFDRKRLSRQVLKPLAEGKAVKYQKLIWDEDRLSGFQKLTDTRYVVVEGISTTHPDIAKDFDYKIWVNVPIETAKQRGLARAGESDNAQHWDLWAANDVRYQQKYHPEISADFVVENY